MPDKERLVEDEDFKASGPKYGRASVLPEWRACDGCRARKIRCDKGSPCVTCVQAKMSCTRSTPKSRQKRTRVLLSSQYENKIDLLDHRLNEITQLLQNLHNADEKRQAERNPKNPSSWPMTGQIPTPSSQVTQQPTPNSPLVDGESSLADHSSFANDYLRQAIYTSNSALPKSSVEMDGFLKTLHHIIDGLKQQPMAAEMVYPDSLSSPKFSFGDLTLPPIQKIVDLIRNLKSQPSEMGTWIHELYPVNQYSDLVMRMYFSQDISHAEFIIANAGFVYLFEDLANQSPDQAEESLACARISRVNLETALNNLPLHLPSNTATVLALTLGAVHAIETSKPSPCWTLISKAAEVCYAMGLHRKSYPVPDGSPAPYEQLLFWCVYAIDKSLSLRLGRAALIPDWDITTPIPTFENSDSKPLMASISVWIAIARCQGNIYEMLYSPESQAQPSHVRKLRVKELAERIQGIQRRKAQIIEHWTHQATNMHENKLAHFSMVSDDVVCLTLLTLVYRASPPPPMASSTPFIPECIETARRTLQKHQECISIIGSAHSVYLPNYIHWTLLFAPFVPFIVLFCNVIGTQNKPDLERLRCFVSSMECAPAVSDTAEKILQLFQVLYNIATRYTESRTSSMAVDQTQVNQELDAYLAQLGFPVPPNGQQTAAHQGSAHNEVPEYNWQSNQMMDDPNVQQGGDYFMPMDTITGLERWVNHNY